MWSNFEARDIMKQMDPIFYEGAIMLWWKHCTGSLDDHLKTFRDDVDAIQM